MNYIYCISIFVLLCFMSCVKEEKGCTDLTAINYNPDAESDDGSCQTIQVPSSYTFGRSLLTSIDYGEQTVRQLLAQDFTQQIADLATTNAVPTSSETLLLVYTEPSPIVPTTTPLNGTALNDIYASIAINASLAAQTDNSFKADSMVRSWVDSIGLYANANRLGNSAVYTTTEGLDLHSLLETTLLGALFYAQGTDLLNNISAYDNTDLVSGFNYTNQENAWDQAFGYFGAARNYSDYTQEELIGATPYKDANEDGFIDFESEYNFAFARLAAQRDASNSEFLFTQQLFQNFLAGRTAISNKTDDSRDSIRIALVQNWEQLIAATAVHHLNRVRTEMSVLNGSTNNFEILNQAWAALWASIFSLPHNSQSQLTDVSEWLALLGDVPVYALPNTEAHNLYLTKLQSIADHLQQTYGFSDSQMLDW